MGYECMFRIQCLSSMGDITKALDDEEDQNWPFQRAGTDLLKELESKENKTDEEELFLEYHPGEIFYNYNLYEVDFLTIFTRMFPTLIFRVFLLKFDFLSGATYIFKGDQYAFEGDLPNFNSYKTDKKIKLPNCPIEFKITEHKPYSAGCLAIPCEITYCFLGETYIYGDGDDHDQELPYKQNLEYKKFTGIEKNEE